MGFGPPHADAAVGRAALPGLLALGILVGVAGGVLAADRDSEAESGSAPATAGVEAGRAAFAEGQAAFRAAQAAVAAHPEERDRAAPRFLRAAAAFERAYRGGGTSATVAADAGTAYAFAGRTGEAVLFYRRALALDPGCARAAEGLAALRADLPIQPPPPTAIEGLGQAVLFWTRALGFGARLWLFGAVYGLGALLLLLRSLLGRPRSGGPAVALLVVGLALFGSCLADVVRARATRAAVVLVRTEGRTGDGAAYSASHSAPFAPGTELRVLEARAGWVHGELRDGSRAWVRTEALGWVAPPPHR